MRSVAVALLVCCFCTSAAAEDEVPDECIPTDRRVAGAMVALAPGLVVPGLGHLTAGEPRTARRLLLAGGISLGSLAVVGPYIYLSGASRRFIGPPTALAVMSVGTLVGMALADFMGLVAPGGLGDAPRGAPRLQLEAGYRHVSDPTRDYAHFLVASASVRLGGGAFGASPGVWLAVDDDNLRARLPLDWRVLRSDRDGSHLSIEAALTVHRFGDEAFTTTFGELSVGGRLDLERLDRRLRGLFHELGAGWAIGQVRYHDLESEHEELLLARFASGAYLGRARGGAGEIALEYDHRHDDFAAGLKMPGLGSGPAGHFGLRFLWVAPSGWGLRADVTAGSAWVTGVSLVFRQGGMR